MLSNQNSVSEALAAPGTLVVPSRQRAAAVRLAASAAAIRSGARIWATPDVLPWHGWLTRELEARRDSLPEGRRLLRPTESWFLWRTIARELAEERGLMTASGLATALPRSLARATDWGLHWSGDAGPEAQVLGAARAAFERRCRTLGAHDASDWTLLAAMPRAASRPLSLAGFDTLGSARIAWLQRSGARLINPGDVPRATPLVHNAVSAAAEIDAAAAWCRERLAADPAARLLVVVPGMDRLRSRLQRSFGQALEPGITRGAAAAAFALEGGQPLADFALVRTALALLTFGARALPFAELSMLLRTPYLALGPVEAAARLELWLRDRNVIRIDPAGLRRLQPAVTRDLGAAAAGIVQRLLESATDEGRSDSAEIWARRHAAQLQRAGWPGQDALGSGELQVRQRFEELLGDFAIAGTSLARLDADAALHWLEALARDSAFEPATDDVAVTISARLDDPVTAYDGIWVCGCDAARWPRPPSPDAFIPLSTQLAAGIPEASAEGQLAEAQRALAAWSAATRELILSWASSDEDAEQTPSGLLGGLAEWRGERRVVAAAGAAPLERLVDPAGPPWTRGSRIPGGVRALQLQAECPFHAFAELRLAAAPVREPARGIDARLRGRLLHAALERLWRDLGSSAALAALSREERDARVWDAVAATATREPNAADLNLPAMLVRAEQRRTAVVIGALLDAEQERRPFRVVELEARRPLLFGAFELQLRLDRVDRLEDGSAAILDYKSGRAEGFDPEAERLHQPQLPCYALAWQGEVAAVAAVHLRRDAIRWRGVADAPDRLPELRASEDWQRLLTLWRTRLEALVQEFVGGAASVTPLPGACEHCHLAGLCRIDMAGPRPDGAARRGDEA